MGNQKRKLFFLVALPRSGNTLLASILNQNPEIAATANSMTLEIMKVLFLLKETDVFKNYPDHKSLDNVLNTVFDNYYKDWPQRIIVDRGPVTTPGNMNVMEQHFGNRFKVIVLVRDLLDVLASFVKWFENEPTAYPNKLGKNIEEKLWSLMNKDGSIAKELIAIQNAFRFKNLKHFKYENICHFIKYDDLVKNPQQTISNLYQFLDEPLYPHQFSNLKQFQLNGMGYDDKELGNNLHMIRTEVRKEDNPYKSMIPKSIVDAYGHITF
jgi:sulfotransferase